MVKKTVLLVFALLIILFSSACILSNFAKQVWENWRAEEIINSFKQEEVDSSTSHPIPTSTVNNSVNPTPTFTLEPIDYKDTSIYRGNLGRRGVYQGPGPKNSPDLLWTFEAEDSIYSTPAIYEGTAFIGSHDGNLYAVDVITGDLIWSFGTGDMVLCPPLISDDILYFGSDDGHLYALDVKTGNELWKFKTGGWVSSSPAISDGRVFVGSYDGFLYALDAQTGQEIWRFEVAGINNPEEGLEKGIGASPAVDDGVVLFGSEQTGGASRELFFYGLDAASGEKRWEFSTWNVVTPPAVSEGVVYFGGFGSFYGLDVITGSLVFDFSTEIVSTAPAIENGVAYFGTEGGVIHAVDLVRAEEIWSFDTGSYLWTPPSISDGVLYFANSAGVISALDCQSGQVLWQYETNEKISTGLVISSGVIYFGTDESHLFAISGD